MPKVSIIMNCFNSSKYLREALDSVFKQTYQDFEVIFWDNGSTDASAAIAQAYGCKLRYFFDSPTKPLGTARNLAIAKAEGSLIAFLDCDDLWLPAKLAKQVALFDANPNLALVCTDTEIFNSQGRLSCLFEGKLPPQGYVFSELIKRQWISMSSAMLKKVALEGLTHWFDERLNVAEEADVFYRLAKDWELDYVPEVLTGWRVHGVNTTFNKFGQFAAETRLILQKHLELYPDYGKEFPELPTLLSQRADFQEAVALWQKGQGGQARQLLKPWLNKTNRKIVAFWLASWLPGSWFGTLSKLYFNLPAWLRKA